MACCLFAAFLFAQCMAMLRRWGMFWGLVPVPQHEVADTARSRVVAWFARPLVRRVAVALLVIEFTGLGAWVYIDHGSHIAAVAAAVAGTHQATSTESVVCRGGLDAGFRAAAGFTPLVAESQPLRRL